MIFHPAFKASVDLVEKNYPDIFRAVYPRRIIPPGNNYGNPRLYAGIATAVIRTAIAPGAEPFIGGMHIALDQWMCESAPVFFVDPKFLAAVAETDLEDNFQFSELKWPFSSFCLVLPMQETEKLIGQCVPWVTVSRAEAGEGRFLFHPKLGYYFKEPRFAIHFPAFAPGAVLPEDYGALWKIEGSLSDLIAKVPFIDGLAAQHELVHRVDKEMGERTNNQILKLTTGIMLAMAARPDYVERGQVVRPARTHKNPSKAQDALWGANVIGRLYREPAPGIGSHASPRTHRRRGHFHRVIKGSRKLPLDVRRQQAEIRWFPATWINL